MTRLAEALNRMTQTSRDRLIAIVASVLLHLFVLIIAVVFSDYTPASSRMPKVIDVDLTMVQAPPAKKTEKKRVKQQVVKKKKQQKKKRKKPAKKKVALKKQKKPEKKKKKVDKSKDIINDAIERLKKDVNKKPEPESKPDPVADRLAAIRDEVKTADDLPDTPAGAGLNRVTDREALLISQYVSEVKIAVQENWSFSASLTGGGKKLETRIVIKVMPDGSVKGIRITKKSGNEYMDSAAAMAIRKSDPVHRFPPGITRDYISIDIGFSPE